MFAVGHLSIGYLSAKICQKRLKTGINLPLVFFLSLVSDVDLLVSRNFHRTVTHSAIVFTIVFMPLFAVYGKSCLPYFAALMQHALIGDLITDGGSQFLWPLTSVSYGLGANMGSSIDVSIEWVSFLLTILILLKTRDAMSLLKSGIPSLLLLVPSAAIFVSSLTDFSPTAPASLLIPHLVLLAIFVSSILKSIYLTLINSTRKKSDR